MNRFTLVVLLAFAPGCNGEEFTTFAAPLGAPDVGAPTASGGATGTGGAQATGGAPGTGGSMVSTGGAPEVDAGAGVGTSGGASQATGGAPATGGAHVIDACALVTHDNGLGQTWQDCVPLGTYSLEQAMKACEAWCDVNGGCACSTGTSSWCRDGLPRVHVAVGDGSFMGWPWQGPSAGDVTKSVIADVSCAVVGTWN